MKKTKEEIEWEDFSTVALGNIVFEVTSRLKVMPDKNKICLIKDLIRWLNTLLEIYKVK